MAKGLSDSELARGTEITGEPIIPPHDVLSLIEPRFSDCAGRPALTDGTTALTYAEISVLSQMVADGLRDLGVRPGDGVVVHSRLSWWAIVAALGIIRARAHYIAIDAAFPLHRRMLIHQAGAAALTIHEPDMTDDLGPGRYVDISALLSNSAKTSSHSALAGIGHSEDGGRAAYTQFTSGSTGTPKAVTVSSAALAYSTAARLHYYDDPVSTFLLCSSISFDSSVAGIFWTLASGGHLVVPTDRPTRLAEIAAAARRHEATHLLMVPSLYQLLLAPELRGQLRSLRAVVVAGEVCQPRLVADHYAALPNTVLYNEYGPTECTVWSTVHRCTPEDGSAPAVPIGRPIPGATAHVRSGDGEPVPFGQAGELWISGPGVVAELPPVEGKPSRLTTVAGVRAYRTGDLVVCRLDGLLEFRGRIDDQLKVGGFRLELGEVEHALVASDLVRTAGVGVSGRAGVGPQQLVAFVVPAEDELNVRELRNELLTRLPAVAVPRKIVAVAELPTQPNGKVDRRDLDRRADGLVS